MLHAIANQIGDGEQFQIVTTTKFDELRNAGHGAVVVHDFANHSGGLEAGDAREVHGGFRLAGANQNAAAARPQRKNVAGAREVFGSGIGVNGGENRGGAIRGADSGGGAAARVNGFAKGRAEGGCIARGHGRKGQGVAALFGEREANEAAAFLGHEVDRLGGDFFGGHGEVAFVFAVFVVHEDNHAALADFFEGFFNSGEWGIGSHFRVSLAPRYFGGNRLIFEPVNCTIIVHFYLAQSAILLRLGKRLPLILKILRSSSNFS